MEGISLMLTMEERLARKIILLARRILARRTAEIRALGLTGPQADALLFFWRGEGESVADLSRALGVSHQNMRGVIARLEEKGLLAAVASEKDGRSKTILVTEAGQALGAQMNVNGLHAVDALLAGMRAEEGDAFYAMISKALDNLEAAPPLLPSEREEGDA